MRRRLPLTGIVVLAALLRLVGLGSRSLWLDEGAEYDAVHGSLGHLFERIANRESTPPLSYLYEWLCTKVIGTSEFALRLPSALCGIAMVPVGYAIGKKLAGDAVEEVVEAPARQVPGQHLVEPQRLRAEGGQSERRR